jgi:hypothetical protein
MKTALILCQLDGFANSRKPHKLKSFLQTHGYDVELFSSGYISRWGSGKYSRYLPGLGFKKLKLYCFELALFLCVHIGNKRLTRICISISTLPTLRVRGQLLNTMFASRGFDLLICETNFDEAILTYRIAKIQLLDSPAPLAEELFYGGEIDQAHYDALVRFEVQVYQAADYLSFHWHTYAEFVKSHKYNGDNFVDLGFGIEQKSLRAHYAEKPRIVFLGYLGGYWINSALLAELSELYEIDVYGGPRVPGVKLNYKGYAPTSEILSEYQFGLITITDDPLRKIGFSAKHIEYFSYGLPVLVPEWRDDALLAPGSIPYNAKNFLTQIQKYSTREEWQEKSSAALDIAKALDWSEVFKPLIPILNSQQ